jgi:hypothetical protein
VGNKLLELELLESLLVPVFGLTPGRAMHNQTITPMKTATANNSNKIHQAIIFVLK